MALPTRMLVDWGGGCRWSNPPSSQSPNPKCSLSSKRLLFPSHETLVDEKVQVSLLHGLWWPCCPFLKTYLPTLNKENQLNVGKYAIHGSYGSSRVFFNWSLQKLPACHASWRCRSRMRCQDPVGNQRPEKRSRSESRGVFCYPPGN